MTNLFHIYIPAIIFICVFVKALPQDSSNSRSSFMNRNNQQFTASKNSSTILLDTKIVLPLTINLSPIDLNEEQLKEFISNKPEKDNVLQAFVLNKLIQQLTSIDSINSLEKSSVHFKNIIESEIPDKQVHLSEKFNLNLHSKADKKVRVSRSPRKTRSIGQNTHRIFPNNVGRRNFKMYKSGFQRRSQLAKSMEQKDEEPLESQNKLANIILDSYNKPSKKEKKSSMQRFLSSTQKFNSIIGGGYSRPTIGPFNSGADHSQLYQDGNYKPHMAHSFNQISLGTATELPITLDIDKRLGKLDSVFNSLHLYSEECRKRIMCEVTREAEKFSPLADILKQGTNVNGNLRELGMELVDTPEGQRLLSYIEASSRGNDRYRQCDVYRYRCRQDVSQLIDMDAMAVWREVVGWLTVKVLAKER